MGSAVTSLNDTRMVLAFFIVLPRYKANIAWITARARLKCVLRLALCTLYQISAVPPATTTKRALNIKTVAYIW